MLIRSQDKQKLVSFDNINFLEIQPLEQNEPQSTEFEIWATTETDFTVIGEYSTQDKALAVLDEIQYNYERNKDAEYFQAGIPNSNYVFEMPADDDPWFDRKDEPEEEPHEVTFSFRCKEVNNG